MISLKITILFISLILFNITKSINIDEDYDDDNDDIQELEDCQSEIDFKTLKKIGTNQLCETLEKPSLKSRIQLKIFTNHTEEKIHIRVLSSLNNLNENKSLVELTTDIIDDFKYPTSLLSIDNYQLISLKTFRTMLLSLISVDFNLLSKNLKKTLLIEKGQAKEKQQLLSCYGNIYPKQDSKLLNIKSAFAKPITCTKEPQNDKFFTLQEKIYLHQSNEKNFRLVQIHQDDPKKISRTTWYTCSNPKSCSNGLQNKSMLDKTVNYVLKFLEKSRTDKKKT
ncbi:unnamed protein product [Rotaria magnacalcarata]